MDVKGLLMNLISVKVERCADVNVDEELSSELQNIWVFSMVSIRMSVCYKVLIIQNNCFPNSVHSYSSSCCLFVIIYHYFCWKYKWYVNSLARNFHTIFDTYRDPTTTCA